MDQGKAASALKAVQQRDPHAVAAAVAAHRGLEQRDESGNTPLLVAMASGQFTIAETLLDGGADPWAVDEFGQTVGHRIVVNPFPPGSVEGDAKQRVLVKLRARGFPYPPPRTEDVLHLVAKGQWPPASAR